MVRTGEVLNKAFSFIQKYFIQIFLYYLLSIVLNVIIMLPVLVGLIVLQLYPRTFNSSMLIQKFSTFNNIITGLLVLIIGLILATIFQLKFSRIPYTKTLMYLYAKFQNKNAEEENEEAKGNIFFQFIKETKWATVIKVLIVNVLTLLLCVLPFLAFILTPLAYNYPWLIVVIVVIAIVIILAIVKPLLILSFVYYPLVDTQDTIVDGINTSKMLLHNTLGVYGILITLIFLFSLGLSLFSVVPALFLGWIPICIYVAFYKELKAKKYYGQSEMI